jgi:competence protein ComEC
VRDRPVKAFNWLTRRNVLAGIAFFPYGKRCPAPLKAAVLGFALGVLILQGQATLPGTLVLLFVVLGALMVQILVWRISPRGFTGVLLSMLAGVALGFAWAGASGQVRLADRLDPAWEGRDLAITGVIASLPQPLDRGVRFEFDVESVEPSQAILPRRVSLTWYNGLTPDEFQMVVPVRAGERWRFGARLRLPHGLANPHGSDQEGWLFERGIRATGFVRARGEHERLTPSVVRPAYVVERLRENLRERFWDVLDQAPYAGILIALAIGDQRAIDPEDWQVFARTGVSHLMSISGLHVTMVSGLLAWLFFSFWRRIPALALWLPAQKAAAAAGAMGAGAYCLLSGFAVPAQRTLYMVAVVALALWLNRLSAASNVLALALFVVLLLDPWAALSPGFWLSFGAVALIFYVGTCRPAKRHWLLQWGAVQWAMTLGLAPLTLVLFQQVSLVSPLANAVAIPLVSLVVTPLALLGAVLPVDALLQLAHALLEWLVPFLELLSRWGGAVWSQHAPLAWTVPFAMLGVVWLLAPRGVPSRFLGGVLLWPMFNTPPPLPAPGELWLRFLDVGQGMAVEARTRHHTLLYDTGPAWGPQSDAGERVLLPYLRAEGVTALDTLVVSHDDNDHSGGAASLLRSLSIGTFISSLKPDHPLHAVQGTALAYRSACRSGMAWSWDGVRFEFLHPGRRPENPFRGTNDDSCVLRIEAGGQRVLLTGDIERIAERELLAAGASQLRADVLLAPHHGSATSSTPEFLDAVSARHAVFQVGYRNRFRHPNPEVLARYRSRHSNIWRTDIHGAIQMKVRQGELAIDVQRVIGQRYWSGH